jgi:hypothetical protein
MADEVRIIRWCDVCPTATPGHRDEATHRFYGMLGLRNNGAPRVLDTCDTHTPPVAAAVTLLQESGRVYRPGTPAPTAAPVPADERPPARRACPLCGWRSTQPGGPTKGLSGHLLNAHKVKPIRQPARCPDCREAIDTPAGMIAHRNRVHGYDHVAALAGRAGRP